MLWLVFLPRRHLFSSPTLFGCVCSEGRRGSRLIQWMFNKYCRVLLQIDEGSAKGTRVETFTASVSRRCPLMRGESQLCLWFVVLVILLFPKGFIWRSLCTAIKWYIYNKCKPLRIIHNFCTTFSSYATIVFVWERYNSAQSSREGFVYKHCHVAKALFTAASVDAIVILIVL